MLQIYVQHAEHFQNDYALLAKKIMLIKELLSGLAIVLTLVAYIPYILSIQKGKSKPHVFSWVIWGLTTLLVSFAQFADGGGLGAWPITVSGMVAFYVAVLAYVKKADTSRTVIDWLFLSVALISLPLWYLAQSPLIAVLILTFVDTLGFGPTFRKSYSLPYSESLLFFVIMAVRNAIAILALENISITTVLFPAMTVFMCSLLILMVKVRRWQLNKSTLGD